MKKIYILIGLVLVVVIAGFWFILKCVDAGGEISPIEYDLGIRCCSGLNRIHTSRYIHPCDTPGEYACDENSCSIPPPTSDKSPWWQCTPCGNGICETEYGENRCNCPEDCKDLKTKCCIECKNAFSKSSVGVGPEMAKCGGFGTAQPLTEECKTYFKNNLMTVSECSGSEKNMSCKQDTDCIEKCPKCRDDSLHHSCTPEFRCTNGTCDCGCICLFKQ